MDIFHFFSLACGLSLFLYGMQRSERGLRFIAGETLKSLIETVTRNRIAGVGVGLGMTMLTQSSTATTVMLVSFASAGLITFSQTLSIILGTDIGTTITVQLFAYKITKFAPLIISIGYLFYAFGKTKKNKSVGQLVLGFGLILFGMTLMSEAVLPLRDNPLFLMLLTMDTSPVTLMLVAAIFTAFIHSSAATIAIVISLALPNDGTVSPVTITKAIPMILGANIGTCGTALIASFNSDIEGKRVAWAHTIFKFIGVALFFPLMPLLHKFAVWSSPGNVASQIANVHSGFNIAMALIFLPFLGLFSKLIQKRVTTGAKKEEQYTVSFINKEFSSMPTLALAQANKELVRMSGLVTGMLEEALLALKNRDEEKINAILAEDDKVDFLQEKLTPYLAKLSEEELNEEVSKKQIQLLMVTSELEQIGDLVSKDIVTYTKKLISNNLHFSEQGMADIKQFYDKIVLNLYNAINAFSMDDLLTASKVIDEKHSINALEEQMRISHFKRLNSGLRETAETTTIHLDILEDLRRINSHAHKIAQSVISLHEKSET